MQKLRKDADQRCTEEDLKCIIFDGRKNWTKIMEKDRGDWQVLPEPGKAGAYCGGK